MPATVAYANDLPEAPPEATVASLFAAPRLLSDLGVREELVTDLFLKHAFQAGDCTMASLARSMKLPIELVETLFHKMKARQMVEIRGSYGEDYHFLLSGVGKALALERMQISRYAGPVPVSLSHYEEAVRRQVGRTRVSRARLHEAYGDLTLEPELMDRLGPALVSQRSMFLYGPSGTGKSSLAERLLRIFDDAVAIPYAFEVEGSIVSVYDAAVHHAAKGNTRDPRDLDPRWIWCSRPCIIIGGELVSSMLELQRDSEVGSYLAPIHLKANNGVFVIDDFGRQMISPRDLLNRWIVPLDRRVDYLSMNSGLKFAVPFEVFVVFSTNLNPNELADEAFLRRIPNKILVDAVSPRVFDEIVRRRVATEEWRAEPEAPRYLRDLCKTRGGDLRPCYPRDIFRIIESIALFEERRPSLNRVDIDRAAELYFGMM